MLMSTRDEKNVFSLKIEQRAESQKISYMEAIIDYCEETDLELEVAATLLNQSLKCKIEEEATDLRCLKITKGSKLPV
jgi:hypothetical protein